MESNCYTRKYCRLCDSGNLRLVAPIGLSPIGGAFVPEDKRNAKQELYPLDMYQCDGCGHVQLLNVVNPKLLFSDYAYFSGKTGLVKHFAEYAGNIMQRAKLKKGSFVVDVGSNDGAFLGFFKNAGMKVLGIDPAENVAKYANDSGIETLPLMFDLKTADFIKDKYGAADIVTANNVFAHTDDLKGMARGVRQLLKEDGLFYFEVSYLVDVIEKMLLGTIFHEHLSYHTVKPLVSFLDSLGLELINVERVPIQGGSIICTAQVKGRGRTVSASVNDLIIYEENRGLYKPGYFSPFTQKLNDTKKSLAELIGNIRSQGKTIAAYGAARGGTLMVYLFDLGRHIEYIVDDDPAKQGLYSPGYHIPVMPTAAMYAKAKLPDCIIILAWVHSKSIINNNRKYLENGGKFITFFPKIEVADKDSAL